MNRWPPLGHTVGREWGCVKPKTGGEQMAGFGVSPLVRSGASGHWVITDGLSLAVGRLWGCARLSGQQHASQLEWTAVGRAGRTVGREWGCARPSGQQHAGRLRLVFLSPGSRWPNWVPSHWSEVGLLLQSYSFWPLAEQMSALGLTVGRVWDCAQLSGQQHAGRLVNSWPHWVAPLVGSGLWLLRAAE